MNREDLMKKLDVGRVGNGTQTYNDVVVTLTKEETIELLKYIDRFIENNEELKFRNKQLFEQNEFLINKNRMLTKAVKLFKRNLYASVLDNNIPKDKTSEALQLLEEALGSVGE